MKILILSGNTGGGHNSAAGAVKEYFCSMGDDCIIKDALAFWGEKKSDLISNGHIYIYKNIPKLFGIMYRFEENHPAKENNNSIIYELVTKGAKRLYKYLLENNFTAVISTHVFACMIVNEVKRSYAPSLKSYFIATDYTCSPGVSELKNTNKYFIPHKDLLPEFINNTIPENKIVPSGIPVKQQFYTTNNIIDYVGLGIPKGKKTVLLMCGSMGCGPIPAIAEGLYLRLPEDYRLVVICGSNKKLFNTLNLALDSKKVTLVGFTKRVSEYLDTASLVLTKPGGLTTTEALSKGVPLILINAVPGCETRNMEFLTSKGYAETGKKPEDLVNIVLSNIHNPEKLQMAKNNILSDFNFNAPKIIRQEIIKDINT